LLLEFFSSCARRQNLLFFPDPPSADFPGTSYSRNGYTDPLLVLMVVDTASDPPKTDFVRIAPPPLACFRSFSVVRLPGDLLFGLTAFTDPTAFFPLSRIWVQRLFTIRLLQMHPSLRLRAHTPPTTLFPPSFECPTHPPARSPPTPPNRSDSLLEILLAYLPKAFSLYPVGAAPRLLAWEYLA